MEFFGPKIIAMIIWGLLGVGALSLICLLVQSQFIKIIGFKLFNLKAVKKLDYWLCKIFFTK